MEVLLYDDEDVLEELVVVVVFLYMCLCVRDATFCKRRVSSTKSTALGSLVWRWLVVALVCVTTAADSEGLDGTDLSGVNKILSNGIFKVCDIILYVYKKGKSKRKKRKKG